jgi:hypothetical protein
MSATPSQDGEPLTGPELFALSYHVAARCDQTNRDYVWCKKNSEDPEKCLEKGAKVTDCVHKL